MKKSVIISVNSILIGVGIMDLNGNIIVEPKFRSISRKSQLLN